MPSLDIPQLRLQNQGISQPRFNRPAEVVSSLLAVQAQDYLGSLWAVGLRLKGAAENDVERALADKSIIRTWPMRGTLHYVAKADVRWLTKLLAPRVVTRAAARLRQLELTATVFKKSRVVIEKALQGNASLTRGELYEILEANDISPKGQRGIHILWQLAQDCVLCFGVRREKQQTFVLLADWAPQTRELSRDEALAELILRYFASHGPATVQDFCWWTGLTHAEAKTRLDSVATKLNQETIAGKTYWFKGNPETTRQDQGLHLLPGFDEYLVGYKDRSPVLELAHKLKVNAGGGMLNPTIISHGQVVGTWKRTLGKDTVTVIPEFFGSLSKADQEAFSLAKKNYAGFLQKGVHLL